MAVEMATQRSRISREGPMDEHNPFGRALDRFMGAENVRAKSQRAFVGMLEEASYPISQQAISGYMNWRSVTREDGTVEWLPRSVAPLEFLGAIFRIFDSPPAQKDDILRAWFEVLPREPRREMIRVIEYMCKSDNASPQAMRKLLEFEEKLEDEL